MRLPKAVTNPVLGLLIEHSGFTSLDAFAAAVNAHGWQAHGMKLGYDHTTVKRWLGGSACQYPELVASVLSAAWAVPLPHQVIWPQMRAGQPRPAAHLTPPVAARTLDDLACFVGSDMLSRRRVLAEAITLTAGPAFIDPMARFLSGPAIGLVPPAEGARIGMSTVDQLEAAKKFFAESDAAFGGGLAREAAAGQLRYAIDIARECRYTKPVGDRLLVLIAELAGIVGWSSHDVAMDGPAQAYFVYGIRAARASDDPGATIVMAGLLADLSRLMTSVGEPVTALRMADLGLELLPRNTCTATAAMLWSLKALAMGPLGRGYQPELRAAVDVSFDLFADADPHDPAIAYAGPAELSGVAGVAFTDAARSDPDRAASLATRAQQHVTSALEQRPAGFARSQVFDHISRSRAHLLTADPEQAAEDIDKAVALAIPIAGSSMRIQQRFRQLDLECGQVATPMPRLHEARQQLRELVISC